MSESRDVSIIVPALNEERFLPRLLASLADQSYADFEIIVADSASTDSTAAIARFFHALVVSGGTPSVGRNSGARAAHGELLFFLDADVVVPPDFLANAVEEMHRRNIALATCRVIPLSGCIADHLVHLLMNLFILLLAPIWPKAPGYAIFVSHALFDRVGGFDESLTLCEDLNFVERAARYRALRYLASVRLWVDLRRYRYEGRLNYVLKSIVMNVYRIFSGEIRNMRFRYHFGVFGTHRDQ